MRSLISALILFISGTMPAAAATVTIDFEYLPLGGAPAPGPGYVEVATAGFLFTSQEGVFESGGNKYIAGLSSGGLFELPEIWIQKEDGGAFSLMSADIGGSVEGYYATSDAGDFDHTTGPSLSELGAGAWLNINTLYLYGQGGQPGFVINTLDNVVVGAAVPIPAAVWLFGSALAGLGWLRRKQTT
jgi:hypothetical protein